MGVVVWAESLYNLRLCWGELAVDRCVFIVYVMDINGVSSGGSMPRLRDVMRRQRRDSDPNMDAPSLDFEYADSDLYFSELSELYSYSEVPEFQNTIELFHSNLESVFGPGAGDWRKLDTGQRKDFIMVMLDRFEVVDTKERMAAVRSLLCLAHGMFATGIEEPEMAIFARENVFLLLEMGVYEATLELLGVEMERGRGVYEGTKTNITIADNHNLRVVLSLLYVLLETVRREDPNDSPKWVSLRSSFLQELEDPVYGDETLTSLLFVMLLSFCNGTMPHYPVKKILLLLWKSVLAMMGGTKELVTLKQEARKAVSLEPSFPENIHSKPLVLPQPNFDPRGQFPSEPPRLLGRPLSIISDTDGIGAATAGGRSMELRPKARKRDVDAYIESCRTKFGCFETGGPGEDLADFPEPIKESIQVLRNHIYVPLSDVQIAKEEELDKQRALSFGQPVDPPERDSPTEKLYRCLLPNLPQYMIALLKVLLAAAPTSRSRNDSLNILVDVLPPEAPANIVESTQVSIDVYRHKEIIVKAISATLLLLLKHFKVNHIYQFEYMGQHLVFANCIPLVLKFFNQNVSQYVAARNNFTGLNFPHCVLYPQDAENITDITESSTTDGGYCWRNLFSCINLVRILQKLTKWKHFRTVMLVVFRSAPILKRALKVRHPMMQQYILKLLKVQTKYLGRNWRKNNMKTISAIYRRVRHHLHDDWAYGNDLDAKPWDFQQQEFALKACIEHFNAVYYSLEGGALVSGTTPPGQVGAGIGQQQQAAGTPAAGLAGVGAGPTTATTGGGAAATAAAQPTSTTAMPMGSGQGASGGKETFEPLELNYLQLLGQEVHLNDIWKEKYEEWLEVEVFGEPTDWDNIIKSPHHFDTKPMEF